MATTNRSRSTLALVLLATVAAWGSGCTQGSSAPGSAGASDAVAASALALEFCDSVTAAQYDRIGGCQGASQELIASWKSKAHASCQALAGEVSAGRAAFDDARARSCAAAIAPLDCASAARRSGGSLTVSLAQCQGAVTGKVALGAPCQDDVNCASGYCTASWNQTCPGTCAAFAGQGLSCADAPCAPGLVCDQGTTCKTPSAASGPCPCAEGSYCDPSGASPRCRLLKTSGACIGKWECAEAEGYTCAGSPRTCQRMAGAGAPCVPAAPSCAPGYQCDPSSGTCRAAPAAGQTCVVADQAGTNSTLACRDAYCDTVSKRCQPLKADGQACARDPECLGYCDPATHRCTAGAGLACAVP